MRDFTGKFLSSFFIFCMIVSLSAFAGNNEKSKQSNKKNKVELGAKKKDVANITKEAIVYPNPTKGKINVVFASAPDTPPAFTVFNILGNDLKNVEVNQLSPTHFEINLADNDAGLYFIRIETAEFMLTERVTLDFTRSYTIS